MKKISITALFILSSCSVLSPGQADALIGTWKNRENRLTGNAQVNIDNTASFKANGTYEWTIAEDGAAPATKTGTYLVGYLAPGQALSLYNSAGGLATNALFFRLISGTNALSNLETSLHANFEQSKIWEKQ